MPRVEVQHCLDGFENNVLTTLSMLTEARSFRIRRQNSYVSIGARRIELFGSFALLRICLSWETFVEDVFCRYLSGARTASGYGPTLLIPPCSSAKVAMQGLLGRQRYLQWSSGEILSRANSCFGSGDPFATAVNAVTNTLEEVVTIRNRFAHRSDYAITKFRSVVMRWFGSVPRGLTPGRFLLSYDPGSGQPFIEFYANTLIGAARAIVP